MLAAFFCNQGFFLGFKDLTHGDVDVVLHAVQNVSAAVSADQVALLLHQAQIPADGFLCHMKAF